MLRLDSDNSHASLNVVQVVAFLLSASYSFDDDRDPHTWYSLGHLLVVRRFRINAAARTIRIHVV